MSGRLPIAVATLAVLGGCVLSNPPPRNSRKTANVVHMTKSDAFHESWIYRHPSRRVADYTRFWLAPISVYENPAKRVADRSVVVMLTDVCTDHLRRELAPDLPFVSEPGPGDLEVRVSIVDLKPKAQFINPDGNMTIKTDPTARGCKFEVDFVDSKTGELIFAASTLIRGEEFAAHLYPEAAQKVEEKFVEWVAFFRSRLKEAVESATPAP